MKFGCTTPFVQNKTKICTDLDISKEALALHEFYLENPEKVCPDLCNFLQTSLRPQVIQKRKIKDRSTDYVRLSIRNTIKVTQSQFLYDGLSVVAEIGGYVGLFLGVSIVDVNKMIQKALEKIAKI